MSVGGGGMNLKGGRVVVLRGRTLRLCVFGIVLTLLLEVICSSICRSEKGLQVDKCVLRNIQDL